MEMVPMPKLFRDMSRKLLRKEAEVDKYGQNPHTRHENARSSRSVAILAKAELNHHLKQLQFQEIVTEWKEKLGTDTKGNINMDRDGDGKINQKDLDAMRNALADDVSFDALLGQLKAQGVIVAQKKEQQTPLPVLSSTDYNQWGGRF